MKKIDIVKIKTSPETYADTEITVGGWVRSARDMKTFGFIDLNDGTSFKGLQLVINADKLSNYAECAKLNTGSSIIATGVLKLTPEAKQPYELETTKIEIISATGADYPIQKKGTSVELLRKLAYLRPRTNLFNAIYRVRSEASFALHQFFNQKGFVYVHAPILTSSDCEGAGQLFKVSTQDIYGGKQLKPEDELMGKAVYLSPSCQLEGEAFALSMGNIYTFGPSFRAEDSNTVKHANEFWHIEPEMAFAELTDNMDIMEEMIKFAINHLFVKCADELKFFEQFVEKGLIEKLKNVTENVFARVDYAEAIKLLQKNNDKFEYKIEFGSDLQSEHEKYLAEVVFKKPVFVYNYPKEIKAFYMRLNDDGKTVAATDMLVPGIGELIGGSQREERLDVLTRRIQELGMNEEEYSFYLDTRRYGTHPHAGFGLGFERMVMYLTGITNIRDVLPFPRTTGSAEY